MTGTPHDAARRGARHSRAAELRRHRPPHLPAGRRELRRRQDHGRGRVVRPLPATPYSRSTTSQPCRSASSGSGKAPIMAAGWTRRASQSTAAAATAREPQADGGPDYCRHLYRHGPADDRLRNIHPLDPTVVTVGVASMAERPTTSFQNAPKSSSASARSIPACATNWSGAFAGSPNARRRATRMTRHRGLSAQL